MVVVVVPLPGPVPADDPTSEACQLANSDAGPAAGHPLGFTQQGCDIYARVILGTRSSVTRGPVDHHRRAADRRHHGRLAGFYGGWLDSVLARITDIFFALPLLLGRDRAACRPMFRTNKTVWTLVLIAGIFGWPQIARIIRGSSSRSGTPTSSRRHRRSARREVRVLLRHVLPNSMAPVIVDRDHLPGRVHRGRGHAVVPGHRTAAQRHVLGQRHQRGADLAPVQPVPLLYPAIALSITVLSFIMLGDAVRDALDPEARKR